MSNNHIDLENMSSMEDLLQQSGNADINEDKIVNGRVAEKNDKGILLDIGFKAEAFIDKAELGEKWDTVKTGDMLEVYLEQMEDEENVPSVSLHKAELQKSWDSIEQNYKEGDLIKGTIKSRVKGGLIVDVGVEAFLPGSQVDLGAVRNLDDFLGKEEEFKILKISAERRNIVLSRRELLEAERAKQRATLLDELVPKTIRRGVVKNITEFGAFVDLNGMDGLLHITDMSWKRISHPSEVVHVGQELEVMILDVDKERQRVSLGLKQKDGNPWDTVDVKYPKGSHVKGRVVNVMPYGAFVELEEGIEGLVHVSEMSWTKKVNKASDVLKEGDEVEAVVLEVSKENKKISLGLRQCQENPWKVIKERFPKGTRIKGVVRNMTGYGAFVQIQDDIDGMIHVSDMSWIRKVNNPSEILHKGMEVEAVILEVDDVNQRISLSMKKLTDDPWQTIQNKYKVGDVVEGKVTKLASFGAFVELEGGIDGLIHISELSDDHVARVKDAVNIGDTVRARVKNISTEERRIGLSLRDVDSENAAASAVTRTEPGEALGDFGSALDDAISASKEEAAPAAEQAPAPAAEDAPAAEPEKAPEA
ncbi:MAG: 30S ribosomal protein S1 [Lentisphaeria bacterium]|nr:30S ribosomal protein S1 [Lentisphaeria bacterium]